MTHIAAYEQFPQFMLNVIKKDENCKVNWTRILDINSNNRNRNIWPLSSQFEVPVVFGTSASTPLSSQDPVAFSFPSIVGQNFQVLGGPTTSVTLDVDETLIPNSLNNFYLETDCNNLAGNHAYSKILTYNGVTKVATLETAIVAADPYNIRKEIPSERAAVVAAASTTSVTLSAGSSAIDGYYVNSYLRIQNGPAANSFAVISAYNGTTKVATLYSPLSAVPVAGNIYEICPFSVDNFQPLFYNGTTTTNQPVCYKITLLGLSVPTATIKNGWKSQVRDYPYFYIKLYNSSQKTGGSNIYSNNPASHLALFKVVPYLSRSEFNWAVFAIPEPQVVSLKIDESLYFEVTLPDGEPIIFDQPDWISPSCPNPLLQISGTFLLERLC